MAHFKSGILGNVNGKVGNLVIRIVNGKEFVSIRPSHYCKSKSETFLKERNKFSAIIKLAAFINSIQTLSQIWNASSIKGFSSYHKILKTNLNLTIAEQLGPAYIIVPPSSILFFPDLNMSSNKISITIQNYHKCSELDLIEDLSLQIVITFPISKIGGKIEYRFFNLSHAINMQNLDGDFDLLISIPADLQMMVNQNKKCVLYSALIWKEKPSDKLNWSSTYCKLITL